MHDPPEDISMKLRRAGGQGLATRDIATALAELLIEKHCDEGELAAQQPLNVTETPERWIVKGSRLYDNDSLPPDLLRPGRVEIEIVKMNCQVIRFIQMGALSSQFD